MTDPATRVRQIAALSRSLAETRISAQSPDGAIEVVADPSGRIHDLRLAADVFERRDPESLARELVKLLNDLRTVADRAARDLMGTIVPGLPDPRTALAAFAGDEPGVPG